MQTIVAPTNFSDVSLNAVNYAADLACVIGANLSLIHVCQLPVAISEVPVSEYSIEELVSDAEKRMAQLKEEILFRTGERIKVSTEVREGEVIRELEEYCSSVSTYAVVIGTEGAGAFERTLFGGKAIGLLRQLVRPLIIVPPGVKFAGIRKIGLACDLNEVIDTIPIDEIKSIVTDMHADFHVLHINTEKEEALNTERMEELRWLREILDGLLPKYHFLKDTDIEKGIADFAEKNNLDLLIVIPKKHGFLGSFLHHSHSKRLVLHTHVPIMAIHE